MQTKLPKPRGLRAYARDETGAVTVDWVVLTAVIILLGGLATSAIRAGLTNKASAISTSINGVGRS
jgi:Flp pilus assembly pilin Flp